MTFDVGQDGNVPKGTVKYQKNEMCSITRKKRSILTLYFRIVKFRSLKSKKPALVSTLIW